MCSDVFKHSVLVSRNVLAVDSFYKIKVVLAHPCDDK